MQRNLAILCSILAPLLSCQLSRKTTMSHLTRCHRHTTMHLHHDQVGLHSFTGLCTSHPWKRLAARLNLSCACAYCRPLTLPLMKTFIIAYFSCQSLSQYTLLPRRASPCVCRSIFSMSCLNHSFPFVYLLFCLTILFCFGSNSQIYSHLTIPVFLTHQNQVWPLCVHDTTWKPFLTSQRRILCGFGFSVASCHRRLVSIRLGSA